MTNQEINVKCAEAMGWKRLGGWYPRWYVPSSQQYVGDWNPSESIADAWVLVEWAKDHGAYFRFDNIEPLPTAMFHRASSGRWYVIDADTAPLAISRAFLAWAEQRKEAR